MEVVDLSEDDVLLKVDSVQHKRLNNEIVDLCDDELEPAAAQNPKRRKTTHQPAGEGWHHRSFS